MRYKTHIKSTLEMNRAHTRTTLSPSHFDCFVRSFVGCFIRLAHLSFKFAHSFVRSFFRSPVNFISVPILIRHVSIIGISCVCMYSMWDSPYCFDLFDRPLISLNHHTIFTKMYLICCTMLAYKSTITKCAMR